MRIHFRAFDKNSSDSMMRTVELKSRKQINEAFSEFEDDVPYGKYWTEVEPDEAPDYKQEAMLSDLAWDY